NTIYCSETTSDGAVWMAGESSVLRLLPGKAAQKFTNEPIRSEAIRALCADGEKLWLGTYYSTLFKWESNAIRVVATNGSLGSDITSLAREGEDVLWVGSSSGLFQWDHGTVRKWTTSGALLTSSIR